MRLQQLTQLGEIPDCGIPARLATTMTMAEQHQWLRSYLRRRPVSRRNFLLGSAAALAATAAGCATAGHRDVRLAVGGRHLGFGADAASSLRFSAQLSGNPHTTAVFLDHGPTPTLGATVTAEVRNLVTQIPNSEGGVLAAEQFYAHAPVTGLSSRTPHFYRWRTAEGFTTDVRSATTAIPAVRNALAPFRFTMMGDQGTDTTPGRPTGLAAGDYDDNSYDDDNDPTVPHAANVLRQIVACRPDFHVLAGDIAYADTSGRGDRPEFVPPGASAGKGFDRFNPYVWDAYFDSIEPSASVTPWLFATGNHDMEAAYDSHGYGGHLARLDSPDSPVPGCPCVYSFSYGNVAVLSLDANDVSSEIRTNTGYSSGRQTSWVQRTLAGYRANPNIDFIVCFFHHCAYSTTNSHASDGGVREAWCALFDRYRVDVVLQGHNHVFERTDPIRAGRVTRAASDNAVVEPDTDGTVYYTVGSGGRARYAFQPGSPETYRGRQVSDTAVPNSFYWGPDGNKRAEAAPWSRVRFRNYAFLRVDVRPGPVTSEMDVVAVDEYGREFDTLTYRRRIADANRR